MEIKKQDLKYKELKDKIKFWKNADRIGPDILWTYWNVFIKSRMQKLCKSKFKEFGDTADFRPGAYAIGCSQISIGERVVIRPGTMLFGESNTIEDTIIIEEDVLIGSGVHIYVENHSFDRVDIPIIDQGHSLAKIVILKKGCWIGANSIILPGVTVGENSVIGAGSVVTKPVPPRQVYAGNPAKFIKSIN